MTKVNLIVFGDIKTNTIFRDFALMNCDYCSETIFLDTDKISCCPSEKCRKKHKFVYSLNKNPDDVNGFDKVLKIEVSDYRKRTLMEVLK